MNLLRLRSDGVVYGFYCFPPPNRGTSGLAWAAQWALEYESVLTLVVSHWPEQPWWPTLLLHLATVPWCSCRNGTSWRCPRAR